MAKHEIIIDHKKYTMPKISADDYMDYLDASETINESTAAGYKREHIQLMCEWIVRLYGQQFTVVLGHRRSNPRSHARGQVHCRKQ